MRKLTIFALAALAAVALPAIAGECLSGFSCDHPCPLAQQANNHRSAGAESVTKAPSVRAVVAAAIERNLRRI